MDCIAAVGCCATAGAKWFAAPAEMHRPEHTRRRVIIQIRWDIRLTSVLPIYLKAACFTGNSSAGTYCLCQRFAVVGNLTADQGYLCYNQGESSSDHVVRSFRCYKAIIRSQFEMWLLWKGWLPSKVVASVTQNQSNVVCCVCKITWVDL